VAEIVPESPSQAVPDKLPVSGVQSLFNLFSGCPEIEIYGLLVKDQGINSNKDKNGFKMDFMESRIGLEL
jgi:hypothetical protein